MTSPEYPRPLPIPDFVQPFTGSQPEVPPERQLLVAERFNDFAQEVLLNHIEAIVTRQYQTEEIPRNEVELVRPDVGGAWLINVMAQAHVGYSEADEERKIPQAGINLEFVDSDREVRHGYQYKLLDGVVTRLDFDDLAVEPGDGEYESAMDEAAAKAARRYDQPIGTVELEGLRAFVISAQPAHQPESD